MKANILFSTLKFKYHSYYMTDNKNDTIAKVYFDPAGYGSVNKTLKDAKKKDKTITLEDVKNFFDLRVNKETNLKGANSFVAPYAYYEYQIDLMFIKYLENKNIQSL